MTVHDLEDQRRRRADELQAAQRALFDYDLWPSGEPYDWMGTNRGTSPYDQLDFHVDLGCGKVKKGRIGVDRYPAPGVNVIADLDRLVTFGIPKQPGEDADDAASPDGPIMGLPFADSSIQSIVSHHALEHVGPGFIDLIDECYRVLVPGGLLRAIVPLFPSWSAVSDPDHVRYFMADGDECSFDAFCGTPGDDSNCCWLASFSVPYTKARFKKVEQDYTPPVPAHHAWTLQDRRELRVALEAQK